VIEAVRVPPSASITSQSSHTVRSQRFLVVIRGIDRPIQSLDSCVRPDCFPRAASRAVFFCRARNHSYSLVTQPLPGPQIPELHRQLAVQITRFFPIHQTLPSP